MKFFRSNIDRRSNVNRRQMDLGSASPDRRAGERRFSGERRNEWVRSSKWSSFDIQVRNRYFWTLIKNRTPSWNSTISFEQDKTPHGKMPGQ
ncbi:hypothetical protein [Desulfospira joergensenii]|uniref:hypothetical protein n=1 Tax=Desulfospira joergensenii TaxID=53329 RepID=UPI0003B618C3|nr:hypothetical protein [Desulfospira joergensenii]